MQRATNCFLKSHAFAVALGVASSFTLLACGADAPGAADTASVSSALEGSASCPAGSLLDPEAQQCAPVVDQRARTAARGAGRLPPNLKAARATADGGPRRARALAASPDHVPGGLGAGVSYKHGQLQATNSATLYTHMIVYPDGLGFDVPADLFTTATNHTDKTVEVVGWYREASVHHIGVFDWSCSTDNPCSGGQTQPSWIWTRPFNDNTCQITQMADQLGVSHATMYYANATVSIAGGFRNDVSFYNYCTNQWDLVYSHAFTGTQRDCSVDDCGWWGPIIENNSPLEDQPFPQLGFLDTRLVHNGVTSLLPPSETDFNGPPSTWHLCFLNPNTSWSTSQVPCSQSQAQWTATLTINSNWATGYCGRVAVRNAGTSAISTWSVSLAMNQSTLTNNDSAAFQSTSAGNYRVTPLSWNSSLAPGASTSFGFCANKTGTNYTPTVTTP